MDAQQFAYWLQGFAELNEAPPTPEQWQSIREHLGTVFVKVTPPVKLAGDPPIRAVKPFVWPPQTSVKDLPFYHELIRSECVQQRFDGATGDCHAYQVALFRKHNSGGVDE